MDSIGDIMEISQFTNTQLGMQPVAKEQEAGGTLGKEGFLQLLVAQMKNQDPTNPLKGTEFASQLAQFNSVEQLLNLNNSMSTMVNSQQMMAQSLSNIMTASLVGKEVRALSNQVDLEAGGTAKVNYRLSSSAETVQISIKDQSGNVIRTETLNNLPSGNNTWQWDGKDGSGQTAAEGMYEVEIKALNGDTEVKALTYIEGEVSSVRYDSEVIQLIVDGVAVSLGNVERVSE